MTSNWWTNPFSSKNSIFYVEPKHYREDVRSAQAAGPLNYSRFVPYKDQWMFSYDHIKSKVLLDPRPRSDVYLPKRNKDRWTPPYVHYDTLDANRQRANKKAIVAKTIPLSNGLVNPHPYILDLHDSQLKLKRSTRFEDAHGTKVSSRWSDANDPSSTVNAVSESRFNPAKFGTQEWRHTEVSPYGLS